MSDRMSNQRGHDEGDKLTTGEMPAPSDERPETPTEDAVKTSIHRDGADPLKQIPANEGGKA